MIEASPTLIDIHEGRVRLKKLLGYRALASAVILFATAYFFYMPAPSSQRPLFITIALTFLLFTGLEWSLIRSRVSFSIQVFAQFAFDMLLVLGLVVLTGGIQSPFVFLFGLIIIAAGTQSHVLIVLLISIMACMCYLAAIYGFSLWQSLPISSSETLHILLQTSALFLVGGVMAAIARRHASLQQESRQAVRQHRRLRELHEQVVSTMQEGVVILDEALHIQDCNPSAYRLLAINHSLSWITLREIADVPDALIDFFDFSKNQTFQCEWKTASGACLVTAAALPGHDPSAHWLLTLVDISDVRKLERKLAEQDKLAAMGRMVAMLAHEIRNPLQTIGQSVELMRTVVKNKQEDIQRILTEEIHRLNRLVSDMLDYVQPLTPEPIPVLCSELIGSSVVQVDMKGAYGVTWRCDLDSLTVDPDHFRLVLDNLLRNAVEASSRPNTVEITLGLANGTGGACWELSVADQGGGIAEEMKGSLFEPFATGRTSGIGLGLATVWQVCQMNDWYVNVEMLEDGSKFIIRGDVKFVEPREVVSG